MRLPAALALLCAASAARADYVYNPADLPEGYVCDADLNAKDCAEKKRWEGWWNAYRDRYDRWYFGMLFNTDIYFQNPEDIEEIDSDQREGGFSPNLVDAVYQIALRHYGDGWAFAVNMVCSDDSDRGRQTCAPTLRMVSFRRYDEIDDATHARLKALLPTTPAEVGYKLGLTAKWEEADLRSCKGALDQLLAFPSQAGAPIWDPVYAGWLRGRVPKPSDELTVTADGDGVFIRATHVGNPSSPKDVAGRSQMVFNQWNGGIGYDWALKMAKVVRPCLRPASSSAPWDRILAATSTAQTGS